MMNKEKDLAYEEKIKSVKRNALITGIVASFVVGGLGFVLGKVVTENNSVSISKEMGAFLNYYNAFKNNYYYEQDERTLIDGLYYGLTSSVSDNFTFYVSSEKNQNQGLSTSQVGIGIERSVYYGNMLINHVMEKSPAKKAKFLDVNNQIIEGEEGLVKGDIIIKIREYDDLNSEYYILKDHPSTEWSSHFSGSENSTLELVILRNGVEKRCIVVRNVFDTDKARLIEKNYTNEKKEAIVEISSFLGNQNSGESTPARELIDIFKNDLFKDNENIDNLVLDLRGNGGGYVLNFSELLSLFTGKQRAYAYYYYPRTNVYTPVEAPNEKSATSIYNYDGWKNYNDSIKHYTIVIDENTASAAESFVLGMRDYEKTKDKVTIVGEISYGKGIAQSFLYPFSKDYDYTSSIRYTSAEVVSMQKNSINKRGIVPDVLVDAKYRSIQDEKIYDYYRKEVKSIESPYDKAIVLSRIEALLGKSFDEKIDNAIKALRKKHGLSEIGEYDKETAKVVNDDFFDYYHNNPPYDIYSSFVNGNDDIDSFSSIQRKVVREQIEEITNQKYDSFYKACIAFQSIYGSAIVNVDKPYNRETAYYLQGKMIDKMFALKDEVLDIARM